MGRSWVGSGSIFTFWLKELIVFDLRIEFLASKSSLGKPQTTFLDPLGSPIGVSKWQIRKLGPQTMTPEGHHSKTKENKLDFVISFNVVSQYIVLIYLQCLDVKNAKTHVTLDVFVLQEKTEKHV